MAFISCTYTRYDPTTNQYIYTIVDSDFGEAVVGVGVGVRVSGWGGVGVAIAREYSKRGLNVGRNLALLVLYRHKQYGDSIDDLKYWQDEYCPKHIDNWEMCAKERDAALEKLIALQ